MGGLKLTEEVAVPADLWNRVKHPDCVERIVAELSDGREVGAGFTRPSGLVAYRIEYKKGPSGEYGLDYKGRVDRVELSNL